MRIHSAIPKRSSSSLRIQIDGRENEDRISISPWLLFWWKRTFLHFFMPETDFGRQDSK